MLYALNPRPVMTNRFQEPFFGETDTYLKSGTDANPCVVTDQFHKKLVHTVATDLKLEYFFFLRKSFIYFFRYGLASQKKREFRWRPPLPLFTTKHLSFR